MIISVWMHKKTGQLYEHLPTFLGSYAITCVDLDSRETSFTSWYDWGKRKLFNFDDTEFYNCGQFEDLGEL